MKLPRNAQLWYPGLRAAQRRARSHRFDQSRPVTVHVMVGDHYEPHWGRPTEAVADARVAAWSDAWPRIADRLRDDEGHPAQWTFFYPQEDYRPQILDALATMTRNGFGDVEVHIHHDGEGEQDFVERMSGFVATLSRDHGLLRQENGRTVFGFIHGNWALDNAHPDGRWCGLNNELTLLRQLGCYADFTMPSAPDPCQTTLVNAIYWAVDDPAKPKSHDSGVIVTPGATAPEGALLCIQGPLALRPHPRWKIVPAIEAGELAHYAAPSPVRTTRWFDYAPRIGNDVFIKLFTHGAPEMNAGPLLGGFITKIFDDIRRESTARGWQLRYETAYQMVQQIEQARREQ